MSKKRSSAESNDYIDQTNEDSESTFPKEGSAKRIKLDSLCDATIHCIPIEILEFILLKAVTIEVNDLKLAKCVWKEKADLVMNRLSTVCSEWTSIVATDFFRSKVHRILEATAPKTFRYEMLQQSKIHSAVYQATAMKDEIFVLCKFYAPKDNKLLVYDVNNTTPVKDVITLPGICPVEIAGCNVASCVYVLNMESQCNSVIRFTKDVGLQNRFSITPWISDLRLPISTISVTASNGNLVVLSRDLLPVDLNSTEPLSTERLLKDPLTRELLTNERRSNVPLSEKRRPLHSVVRIYNSNGSVQTEMTLSWNIYSTRNAFRVIQKSSGNLLLGSTNDQYRLVLTEMDETGRILRQYQSEFWGNYSSFADIGGRILISSCRSAMELLDSELNPLDSSGLQMNERHFVLESRLHYNSERNEIVRVGYHFGLWSRVLAIFRLTEESSEESRLC